MASITESELRMQELENIRAQLRRHLDMMVFKGRKDFLIKYDAKILLTKGEELMMRKQTVEYRRDVLIVSVHFSKKRRARKTSVTHIDVHAIRRRVPIIF